MIHFKIYAPYHLDDLFSMVVRPNKLIVTREIFENKATKIYSYEGNLSDTENTTVLGGQMQFKKPFCLLCKDSSLDLVTTLRYYDVR